MTAGTIRVVYDCNVFLQGMISDRGPGRTCLQLVEEGKVALFISPRVLEEIRGLPSHPRLRRFKALTAERIEKFVVRLVSKSILFKDAPGVFTYDRDPDDVHYLDLAVAAEAGYLVSRDRDLLDLMTTRTTAAIEFKAKFPKLKILDPVAFLNEFRALNTE